VPPVITNVTSYQFVLEGDDVTLSVDGGNVVAPGTTNLITPATYQWSSNATPILGATGPTLRLTAVRLADAANYQVTLSNDFGTASTNVRVAVLKFGGSGGVLNSGDSATFGATFASDCASAPSYQWLRDGQRLSGRIGPTLLLSNTTVANAGNYSVIASNCFGMMTSAVSTVSVAASFRIMIGSRQDGPHFRWLSSSYPACGVVLEWTSELPNSPTFWQPFATNLDMHAVINLPFDSGTRRFYRARLLPCLP